MPYEYVAIVCAARVSIDGAVSTTHGMPTPITTQNSARIPQLGYRANPYERIQTSPSTIGIHVHDGKRGTTRRRSIQYANTPIRKHGMKRSTGKRHIDGMRCGSGMPNDDSPANAHPATSIAIIGAADLPPPTTKTNGSSTILPASRGGNQSTGSTTSPPLMPSH